MYQTLNPAYKNRITEVSKLGVTGGGATSGSKAFIEAGYKVVDLGNDSTRALATCREESIQFLAVIEPVGTDGSWWDGFFDFAMRITETEDNVIVWSANAEYGYGGLYINQNRSTRSAFRDMAKSFSENFPPEGKFSQGGLSP